MQPTYNHERIKLLREATDIGIMKDMLWYLVRNTIRFQYILLNLTEIKKLSKTVMYFVLFRQNKS